MAAAAQAAGLNLVDSEAYQATSPDYKALLQRVKSKNPDAIYFASYLLDAGTLMRQSEQLNLNPKYYTSAGTGFAAAEFPSPGEGRRQICRVYFLGFAVVALRQMEGFAGVRREIYKAGGHASGLPRDGGIRCAAGGAEALKNAGAGATPTAIRDAIRNLNIAETPFGPVKFDARGRTRTRCW